MKRFLHAVIVYFCRFSLRKLVSATSSLCCHISLVSVYVFFFPFISSTRESLKMDLRNLNAQDGISHLYRISSRFVRSGKRCDISNEFCLKRPNYKGTNLLLQVYPSGRTTSIKWHRFHRLFSQRSNLRARTPSFR